MNIFLTWHVISKEYGDYVFIQCRASIMHQRLWDLSACLQKKVMITDRFRNGELDGVLIRKKAYTDVSVDKNMVFLKFDYLDCCEYLQTLWSLTSYLHFATRWYIIMGKHGFIFRKFVSHFPLSWEKQMQFSLWCWSVKLYVGWAYLSGRAV
jgi:hypothetical protein